MDENLQKLISKLSNRYLAGSLIELQDTISDEWKPSDSQLYYFVAVCQKTIEELDANPPKIKDYYSCSIVGTRGPKDFLICTLEVIDEAFEESPLLGIVFGGTRAVFNCLADCKQAPRTGALSGRRNNDVLKHERYLQK